MLKNILAKLRNADIIIAAFVLAVLIIYTFFAVVMRYFVGRPILWGEEFQLICMVTIVFLGSGAGFRTGSHIAIDFLVVMFSWKVQKLIALFIYLLAMLIVLYFFIQGFVFISQMYSTARITGILRIPFFLIYLVFPIGCISILVNYTISVYIRYVKHSDDSGKDILK